MTTAMTAAPPITPPAIETFANNLHLLGDIPAERVVAHPYPATEDDLVRLVDGEPKRLVELVDGFLVEKAMGYREGVLGLWIGTLLNNFVFPRQLGVVGGADSIMRLKPGLNRLPDVHFKAWSRLPTPDAHDRPVGAFGPDLAVEVLSESNTRREIERRRREYFAAGAQLVWVVDPVTRSVDVFTGPDASILLSIADVLDGGPVLPGFRLPVADIFAYMVRPPL